jgi:hypothetical protein
MLNLVRSECTLVIALLTGDLKRLRNNILTAISLKFCTILHSIVLMRHAMLSQDDANQCIEAAAAALKSMSYDELKKLCAEQNRDALPLNKELIVSGETVYVNVAIGELNRIRKRVCVEMVLSAESGALWPETPSVYFERFESGHLYDRRPRQWEIALFRAMPHMFVIAIVMALFVVVWYLFLRSK